MKFVIQRVNYASVTVDNEVIGKIDKGFMVLMGACDEDDEAIADKMVKKLVGLRIFEDSEGKTNLALKDVDGQLLIVSQFTLYADCKKGNRPSFIKSGSPEHAEKLYNYVIDQCKKEIAVVETGSFGAEMKIALENDGPFTIVLDSDEIIKK